MEKLPIPHDRETLNVEDFALQALVDMMIARHDREAFEVATRILNVNKHITGDER